MAENDAVAAGGQSTIGGTYYGTTDVLVNTNEHLSCPTTLQFDPNTSSAIVTVNYRGNEMMTKVAGTFRDGVFHGRSEGQFYGLVYVQAMNYVLKFDRRSGTVKTTSWAVNPAPDSDNKPETDVYRRTRPASELNGEHEAENSAGSEDDRSDDSNRSGKNKEESKRLHGDAKKSHLEADRHEPAKSRPGLTKLLKSDTSKTKTVTTTSHKK